MEILPLSPGIWRGERGDLKLVSKSLVSQIISTTVLTVLIAFIGIMLPLLASFFWAVPIAVLVARKGLMPGLLAAVAAFGLLAFLVYPQWALLAALQFGSLGLVLGYFFSKGSSLKTVLIQAIAVSLVVSLVVFVMPYFPANPVEAVRAELSGSIDEVISAWESAGFLDNLPREYSSEELNEMLQEVVGWFASLLPSLLAVSALGAAFFNFLVSRRVLDRKDYEVAKFPPFREWWVPWQISWVAVIGLGLALLGDYLNAGLIRIFGLNLVVLHFPVALIIGIAVVVFYFSRIKSWLFQAALAFMALFYLPLTVLLTAILGAFDPLFDFRKIHFKSDVHKE